MDCKSEELGEIYRIPTTLTPLHQSHFTPIQNAIDSLNYSEGLPTERSSSALPLPESLLPPTFEDSLGHFTVEIGPSGTDGTLEHPTAGYSVVRGGQVYGVVEGSYVGQTFKARWLLREAGIHRPIQAGISGTPLHGAESVVLSGGYEDDVDNGEEVTYTGCGGFVKRVQVMNQTQENPSNAALCTSISTKVPVRVVRGFSLKSAYAPVEGYRYDGLYIVTSMWKERRRKLVVLRFHLERLEGQPPIPVREKISRKRNLPKTRENVRQQRVPQPKNKLKRKNPTSLRSATFPSDFAVPYPIISPSFVAPVSMDVFREPIWL